MRSRAVPKLNAIYGVAPMIHALLVRAIALLAVTVTSLSTRPAPAADIDLSMPEGVLQANRKVQCSLIDGKPIT